MDVKHTGIFKLKIPVCFTSIKNRSNIYSFTDKNSPHIKLNCNNIRFVLASKARCTYWQNTVDVLSVVILKWRMRGGKPPSSSNISYLPDSPQYYLQVVLSCFSSPTGYSGCMLCLYPHPAIYPVHRVILYSTVLRIRDFTCI